MNDQMKGLSERFEIVSDIPRYAANLRIVGTAYKNQTEDHYILRLRVFPFIKYFLRAKEKGSEDFLIYSGLEKHGGVTRLFHVMGKGELVCDEYVKLTLYDLGLICYLRLNPKDYHFADRASA